MSLSENGQLVEIMRAKGPNDPVTPYYGFNLLDSLNTLSEESFFNLYLQSREFFQSYKPGHGYHWVSCIADRFFTDWATREALSTPLTQGKSPLNFLSHWRMLVMVHGSHPRRINSSYFGCPKSLQMVIATMKLKDAYSLEGKLWPT